MCLFSKKVKLPITAAKTHGMIVLYNSYHTQNPTIKLKVLRNLKGYSIELWSRSTIIRKDMLLGRRFNGSFS